MTLHLVWVQIIRQVAGHKNDKYSNKFKNIPSLIYQIAILTTKERYLRLNPWVHCFLMKSSLPMLWQKSKAHVAQTFLLKALDAQSL